MKNIQQKTKTILFPTYGGSFAESCDNVRERDAVVLKVQGYYESGWIKEWYGSVPMLEFLLI